jgi:hypothetical protein
MLADFVIPAARELLDVAVVSIFSEYLPFCVFTHPKKIYEETLHRMHLKIQPS